MIDLQAAYQARLSEGDLRPDPAQQTALAMLQGFAERLEGYSPRKPTLLGRLFSAATPAPQGLYIHGSVGRGKSILMDLFFGAVAVTRKRRVHFHQFMLEIHERLFRLQNDKSPDILQRVAKEIAAETWLLCFDEFHVGNIADAMILGRLFEALFKAGVVVVATSNWQPPELYKNGLQRERFLPFIDLIQQHMAVYHLDGTVDHRFEQTQALPGYVYPLSPEHTQELHDIFFHLTHHAEPSLVLLPVQGRVLRLTHTAKGVGFFNFNELCEAPLGAADFLALAENIHTLLIDEVPQMCEDKRNETTRFINLIDALYEAKVKLHLAAETPLDKLAPTGELNFPFQRTVSRLMEMQSEEYRKKPHLGG
jgi:cell division protein ZapE